MISMMGGRHMGLLYTWDVLIVLTWLVNLELIQLFITFNKNKRDRVHNDCYEAP